MIEIIPSIAKAFGAFLKTAGTSKPTVEGFKAFIEEASPASTSPPGLDLKTISDATISHLIACANKQRPWLV